MSGLIQEAGGSLNDHIDRVRMAWSSQRDGEPGPYSWVMDVFDTHVVISWGGYADDKKYYQVNYAATDDGVTFAPETEWVKVQLSYVPVARETDTAEVTESFRALVEATANGPEAVIIVEGLSANGRMYTRKALESGAGVFSNRPIFIDHPTKTEERERPERSVRDLAGRLGEAYLGKDKNGKAALRAPIKFSSTAKWLETLVTEGVAGDMSINAAGRGRSDKDGMFVVESFVEHPYTSLDFVTVAAAGGYADLSESQRTKLFESFNRETLLQHRPDLIEELQEAGAVTVLLKEGGMKPEEIQQLQESNKKLLEENVRLFREVRTKEAQGVLETLFTPGMPDVAREKLREQVKPAIESYATHGSEQTAEQLKEALVKAVEAEKTYLAKIMPHGVVTGVTAPVQETVDVDAKLKEAFTGLVPDNAIAIAVKGRT